MNFMTDCWRCDRRKPSRQVVWPTYTETKPKLLIIGEAPGPDEDEQGRGFVGQAGGILREQLVEAGFDPDRDVAYTNTVFCYGGSVKNKPSVEQIKCCSRNLWRAVLHAQADVVVTAGKYATAAVMGFSKMKELHGTYRYTTPPKNVWAAVRLEDFCFDHGIDFPMGEDGVSPDRMADPVFLENFVKPLEAKGFQLEALPQLKVLPILHPSSFQYDGKINERYKLGDAFKKARVWIEGVTEEKSDKDYKALLDCSEAIAYMDEIIDMHKGGLIQWFAMDLETVGAPDNKVKGALKPFLPGGQVITINLSHKPHFGRVIFMEHPEATMTLDQKRQVAEKYCELLATVPVVGANIKFDLHWSRFKLGARKWKIAFDTQLASYAIHLGTRMENGLKALTERNLSDDAGYANELNEFLDQLPKEERHFQNIPLNKLMHYAAEDVDVVLQLIPILADKLVRTKQWEPFHLFGIHPYAAFIEMEQNGGCIDGEMRDRLADVAEKEMAEIKARFRESPYRREWTRRRIAKADAERAKKKTKKARTKPYQMGELELNFGSTYHLAELLFDILRMPLVSALGKIKTDMFPNGMPSTNEASLDLMSEKLSEFGESEGVRADVLEMIKDYRKASKIHSTYLKKAYDNCPVVERPEWWDTRGALNDCRCYEAELYVALCQSASFNLTTARTGRTTSSGPNIQQVPKKIRKMYLSRFGKRGLLANFDVGQAELRVIAAASGDRNFIAILSDPNRDVHREVAAMGFQKAIEDVTDDERFQAKAVVFGTVYGRGPASIAKQLKISVERAETIQAALFAMMPQAAEWINQRHYEADTPYWDHEAGLQRQGVWTPTGRWRDLSTYYDEGDRHRRAVNTPIQGGASDIIIWATGFIHHSMQEAQLESKLWAYVHDSVVFDVIPEEAAFLMQATRTHLVDQIPHRFPWMIVPMVVDFQFGPNWGDQCDCAFNFETGDISLEGEKDTLVEVVDRFGDCIGNAQYQGDWEVLAAEGKKIKISGKWQKSLQMAG